MTWTQNDIKAFVTPYSVKNILHDIRKQDSYTNFRNLFHWFFCVCFSIPWNTPSNPWIWIFTDERFPIIKFHISEESATFEANFGVVKLCAAAHFLIMEKFTLIRMLNSVLERVVVKKYIIRQVTKHFSQYSSTCGYSSLLIQKTLLRKI